MLRSGPVPFFVHGIIEYLAAIAFIVAPFILGFENETSIWLSVGVGVGILIVAATTVGSTSLVNVMPISVHVLVDYVLAFALIAMPFLFGFSDERAPTAWFITLGVVHLLLTIATRFKPAVAAADSTTQSRAHAGGDPTGPEPGSASPIIGTDTRE